MRLYWLSTAITLAASVSAGVVPNGSPIKQLTASQGGVMSQQTVTSYFQQSTATIETCKSQISTLTTTEVQAAVKAITTTVNTITGQFAGSEKCACGGLASDPSFGAIVQALIIQLNDLVQIVTLRFRTLLHYFNSCWTLIEHYFGTLASFTATIYLDLSVLLQGVKLDILAAVGINLNVLGINLGVGVGLGVGIN